jgi:hypothetical protein
MCLMICEGAVHVGFGPPLHAPQSRIAAGVVNGGGCVVALSVLRDYPSLRKHASALPTRAHDVP